RRTANRGGVRHSRGRLPDLPVAGQPGPADDHGHRGLRRVFHRPRQRPRGHPVRAARPEGEAVMTATTGTGPPVPLLEVTDLRVTFDTEDGVVRAVDGVSFELGEGETLGIVGESGSGKSVTMMSVMRLIIDPNAHFSGSVFYRGQDLMALDKKEMRVVRGSEVAMIFQDPMTSLNPVYKVGWQIAEQIRAHRKVSKAEAHKLAVELLAAVGIPNAARRADDYPHHFSG